MSPVDDLGADVPIGAAPRRVVSLVPSLTESVASVDVTLLVGATDWCTHPADLDVARVRGTKNPDVAAIVALRPDLVLANREENRELDVRRLRAAGVPVWVTEIADLDGALRSLRRMFAGALQVPAPAWLDAAEQAWSVPAPEPVRGVVIPIWRDPWMVVGRDTFTGSVAARLGLRNVFGCADERYPHVTVAQILDLAPDLVVLPSEPYAFGPGDGPEAFPGVPVAFVDGRLLTWYGPSLADARDQLAAAVRADGR